VTTCTPAAGQGVQNHGQGGDQGLALAGLHFRDLALVQDHAAHELDVEMAHAEERRLASRVRAKTSGSRDVKVPPTGHFLAVPGHAAGKSAVRRGPASPFQGR
jgi:hypothetical protein